MESIIVFVGSLKRFKPNTVGIEAHCGKCDCKVHLSDTTIRALKQHEGHPVILICEDHWEAELEGNINLVPLNQEQIEEIKNFIS